MKAGAFRQTGSEAASIAGSPHGRALPDHVQAALDASCAALIALEAAREEILHASVDLGRSQEAETQAIELVRLAIGELRSSSGHAESSPLAYGFAQDATASGKVIADRVDSGLDPARQTELGEDA